jgi:hypothetical protein
MRQHDRYRFADIAHPVDRQAPLLHRGLDRDRKGPGPAPRVLAGNGARDPRHRERGGGIDRDELGMRVRRAQDRGMQRAARHRQIVAEPAAAEQQIGVFEALQRLSGGGAGHLARSCISAIVGPVAAARQAGGQEERGAATPCLVDRRR